VHFVMTDFCHRAVIIFNLVEEQPVVACLVEWAAWNVCKFKEWLNVKVFAFERFHFFKRVGKTFRAVEKCRFVHVVPKAFYSQVDEFFVLRSKPSARVFIQEIRKPRVARPHAAGKVRAVFLLAEESFCFSFIADWISFFNLYARIDYRHKPHVLCLHFRDEWFECRKFFFAYGEVLEVVHVVNVKVHCVERNVAFTVFFYYGTYIVFRAVAPAALLVAECPERCNITSAHQRPELRHNVVKNVCAFIWRNHIQCNVSSIGADSERVFLRKANVKFNAGGVVKVKPESFFAAYDDEVVRSVQRFTVLWLVWNVAAVAHVLEAALVYAAYWFAKAKDNVFRLERACVCKRIFRFCRGCRFHSAKGNFFCAFCNRQNAGKSVERFSKSKFFYHK